ncbi:MAG: carboxypeptidase-like regulatory domain-containing protein [Candidatus Sericytochromatia bacterium]
MRLICGLASLVLMGCVVAAPGPVPSGGATPFAPSPPIDAPTVSPTASASTAPLAGTWQLGQPGDPTPVPNAVSGGPSHWLSMNGDVVTGRREQYCGKPTEELTGHLVGVRLTLTGTHHLGQFESPVTYELTYEPATGRYVGTRNGKPVWLKPAAIVPSAGMCWELAMAGRVFTEDGAALTGDARITIHSSNPSLPYDSTIALVNGAYRAMVAANTPLTVTVEATGYHPRTRVVTVERGPEWVINFGGPADPEDPDGWKYPLEPLVKPSPLPSGPSGVAS